ncbi:mechanosensitive ion channel family protein [Acetanaerobacterium elongatum]|uniref:Small conductance mechanosensitive channel n=1 Tax=Acetanaerobacterium elongatum TaxID=258515 RepID=A0A1G9WIH4_9FIRM|nr:mechanosensitive ion channel domain-containing protein [Acetanaerobacterium elongatum]SDM83981.1 small conductance mechanosensitive channel [Acetanaerobacterium elongatum]
MPNTLPTLEDAKRWLINYYPSLIGALFLLAAGMLFVHFAVKLLVKGLKKSRVDATMHHFIASTIKITLYTVLALLIISTLRVPTTPLVTLLGAAGLALSLALKDTLSNVASGIVLLYNHPFKHGDFVEVNGRQGTVLEINYTYTKLRTIDNKVIFIPNSQVSSTDIINFSSEKTRRLDLVFNISYLNDFEKAKLLILEIIRNNDYALKTPEPVVRVSGHGEHAINICCLVWVDSGDYLNLRYDLYEQVKTAFDRNGITIPYNQLDVTLVNPQKASG